MMAMVENRVVVGGSFVIVMVKVRDACACVMRDACRQGPKRSERYENLLDPIKINIRKPFGSKRY